MAASIAERLRLRVLHLGFLVTRPMSLGVRGIVINSADEVMLVRHGYVSGWHFPGGGVEVGETCVESVTRKLEEEACIAPEAPPVDWKASTAFRWRRKNGRAAIEPVLEPATGLL